MTRREITDLTVQLAQSTRIASCVTCSEESAVIASAAIQKLSLEQILLMEQYLRMKRSLVNRIFECDSKGNISVVSGNSCFDISDFIEALEWTQELPDWYNQASNIRQT